MLTRIIQRAGGLKFTLGLVDFNFSQREDGWREFDFAPIRSRCQAIHFWWWANTADRQDFTNGLVNMIALEELHFHSDVFLPQEVSSNIMLDVQSNSRRLTTLTVLSRIYPHSEEDVLKPFSELLKRLKLLTCSNQYGNEQDAVSKAVEYSRLTELDVDMAWMSRVNPQAPQLQRLVLRNQATYIEPLRSYTSITSLSIYCGRTYSWLFSSMKKSRVLFPELKYLLLDGTWAYIQIIDTPKLETLKLRGAPGRGEESKEEHLQFGPADVRPRVLHMDKAVSEKTLVGLLRDEWKDIEELHLTTMKKGEAVGKTLLTGFLGTTYDEPASPSLQRLQIAYPVMYEEGIGIQEQEAEMARARDVTMKRLKTIIEGRKDGGKLQRVALGWYPATTKSVMQDKNDFWDVEWSRIL